MLLEVFGRASDLYCQSFSPTPPSMPLPFFLKEAIPFRGGGGGGTGKQK